MPYTLHKLFPIFEQECHLSVKLQICEKALNVPQIN